MKLSIVIPVFNEKNTILEVLKRVEAVVLPLGKEIILVDDCSTDGTREMLKSLPAEKYRIFYHDINQGKGAAVRLGFNQASGDIIIVQDADLEYDPEEYGKLIKPIMDGKADVVYGSRLIGGGETRRVLYFWHYLGNKLLTILSNALSNLNLSDMETCYKVFSKASLEKIRPRLTSNRFGIEPEITMLIGRNKFKVYEVGISYSGRTYKEGKKINWKDGLAAFWHIVKFGVRR
ncbi:MAG: glycosyltransferase family 2 protein [Patescibacteria group bacterium]|jgi:glycosyltransferase involved in cell wall biosynthesis